jgi:hypothetical protein
MQKPSAGVFFADYKAALYVAHDNSLSNDPAIAVPLTGIGLHRQACW